ncbi:GNAT family N-acetyltransferase [Leifsonia xyli]|uniref:GNAT family N-acetyltransferase n=1 Tax=Leifsonia xyli TaxID=1575 RepID=UPI003D669C18
MRLPIPDALGTRESAAYEELIGVLNGIVVDLWGDDDFVETAEQALAAHRDQEYAERILFVAVEGDAIVGRVEAIFPLDEDSETVSLLVDVAPALRGRGIGTALLEKGEELAAEGAGASSRRTPSIRSARWRAPTGWCARPPAQRDCRASRTMCASLCTTATRSGRSSGPANCTCPCRRSARPG